MELGLTGSLSIPVSHSGWAGWWEDTETVGLFLVVSSLDIPGQSIHPGQGSIH